MSLERLVDEEDDDGGLDELKPGTKLLHGQYTISRYLNCGGFGITYLAKDSLDRDVVIKECYADAFCRRTDTVVSARSRAHQGELKSIIRHFVQEAQSLSKLVHPNIVGVHQVFEDNDTAYMAIDYVEGQDLLEILDDPKQTLDPDHIVAITRKLLSAVGFLHDSSLLHRDISPDNILLNKAGEPILIDFGAARENTALSNKKHSALRVVKDGYSPQEFYITGSDQGPWSDLYALAASLYHAIVGEPPINGQNRLVAIAEQRADPYVPLAGKVEGYPPGFLEAIDKALITMPAKRIQTAQEWLDMLDNPRGAAAIGTGPKKNGNRVSKLFQTIDGVPEADSGSRSRRRKMLVAGSIVGIVAALGLLGYNNYSAKQTAIAVEQAETTRIAAEVETARIEAEAEAAAERLAAQAEAARLASEEEAARQTAEAEAARLAAEEEAARIAAEEEAQIAAQAEAENAAAEAELARIAEEEAARAEAARTSAEEAARASAETAAARVAAEQEAERQAASAEAQRIAEEEQAAQLAAEEAEAGRRAAEEEAERQAAADEAARVAAVEEEARLAAEAEAQRADAEANAVRAAEEAELGRRAAEEEAVRQAAAQEEAARVAAEEQMAQEVAATGPSGDTGTINAPQLSNVQDAAPVMSATFAQLPFRASQSDPSVVGAVDADVPAWLRAGKKIVSVNGVPVQSINEIPKVIAATTEIESEQSVTLELGVEEQISKTAILRELEIPVVENIALLNGTQFQSSIENGAWVTLVTASSGNRDDEFQVGDIVISYLATNEGVDGRRGLFEILDREIANGTASFNFAVNRDDAMWLVTMYYNAAIVN